MTSPPSADGVVAAVPSSLPEINDGRGAGNFASRYPIGTRIQQFAEAAYLVVLLAVVALICLSVLTGVAPKFFGFDAGSGPEKGLRMFAFVAAGGLLGGVLFGMKFLYHAVAKGIWNQDRLLWRALSPLLSLGLAIAAGALLDSGIAGLTFKSDSNSTHFAVGFIVGYFADKAIQKMADIADTVFGMKETGKSSSI